MHHLPPTSVYLATCVLIKTQSAAGHATLRGVLSWTWWLAENGLSHHKAYESIKDKDQPWSRFLVKTNVQRLSWQSYLWWNNPMWLSQWAPGSDPGCMTNSRSQIFTKQQDGSIFKEIKWQQNDKIPKTFGIYKGDRGQTVFVSETLFQQMLMCCHDAFTLLNLTLKIPTVFQFLYNKWNQYEVTKCMFKSSTTQMKPLNGHDMEDIWINSLRQSVKETKTKNRTRPHTNNVAPSPLLSVFRIVAFFESECSSSSVGYCGGKDKGNEC